jgi:hypothetical protein
VIGNLRRQRGLIQQGIERDQMDVRVNARQRLAGGIHLRLADGGVAVQRLALQVGERDGVEIEQGELPTPAAARYCAAAQPSPPRPTTSTRAAFSRSWPSKSKPRKTICRL